MKERPLKSGLFQYNRNMEHLICEECMFCHEFQKFPTRDIAVLFKCGIFHATMWQTKDKFISLHNCSYYMRREQKCS